MKLLRNGAARFWDWVTSHPADSLSVLSFGCLVAGAGIVAGSFWGAAAGVGTSLLVGGFITFTFLTASHVLGWAAPPHQGEDPDAP